MGTAAAKERTSSAPAPRGPKNRVRGLRPSRAPRVGVTSLPTYQPRWGNRFAYDGSASDQRYPGQYFDAESGLHYNYFRDYDPKTGRYIEPDPIGLIYGKNHLYVYVRGNPINKIDPSGLIDWSGSFTGISVSSVVGASVYRYNLRSECVNGKRGIAKGWAYGGTAGVGVTISGTTSDITFHDFESSPNPWVFNGTFTIVSAGIDIPHRVTEGKGVGYTALLLLGNAYAEAGIGIIKGFDFSASFCAGSSTVTEGRVERCDECSK